MAENRTGSGVPVPRLDQAPLGTRALEAAPAMPLMPWVRSLPPPPPSPPPTWRAARRVGACAREFWRWPPGRIAVQIVAVTLVMMPAFSHWISAATS